MVEDTGRRLGGWAGRLARPCSSARGTTGEYRCYPPVALASVSGMPVGG